VKIALMFWRPLPGIRFVFAERQRLYAKAFGGHKAAAKLFPKTAIFQALSRSSSKNHIT